MMIKHELLKQIFTTLLFLFITSLSAQVVFDKGYFINNKDEKFEVLIKNEDQLINPTKFTYKMTGSDKIYTGTLADIKEFGVYNFSRYVRFTGMIDNSTDDLQRLTESKNPIWVNNTIFLKQLITGDKKLYSYNSDKYIRFFYEDQNTPITQLVYKRYFLDGNADNAYTNNEYKNQLKKYFNSNNLNSKIEKLRYNETSLIKFFQTTIESNEVENARISAIKKSKINLYIRPGIAFSSIKTDLNYAQTNTNFENKISPRLGVELEYVFPFNKNKWALWLEPTYQTYKQTTRTSLESDASINYSVLEIPIGVRHYMYLNNNSKFFIEGLMNVIDFQVGENYMRYNVPATTYERTLGLSSMVNFGVGFGFTYKNKFVVQARHHLKKRLGNETYLEMNYHNFSLIAGYNLF